MIYALQIIKAPLTIGMQLEINSEVNMDYVEARPLSKNAEAEGFEPPGQR